METDNKKPRNCTMVMIWIIMGIIAAAVVCCVVGFFCPVFKYADENNLVITFLGALAAFVVISNYAQMVEMRNETNKKLDEVNEKIKLIEDYLNDSVLKDLSKILSREDPFFRITVKNIISVKHRRNNIYHTEVRMVKREGKYLKIGEYDVKYYEVDIANGTCRSIIKEEFDKD